MTRRSAGAPVVPRYPPPNDKPNSAPPGPAPFACVLKCGADSSTVMKPMPNRAASSISTWTSPRKNTSNAECRVLSRFERSRKRSPKRNSGLHGGANHRVRLERGKRLCAASGRLATRTIFEPVLARNAALRRLVDAFLDLFGGRTHPYGHHHPVAAPHKRLLKDCGFVADALFCWHMKQPSSALAELDDWGILCVSGAEKRGHFGAPPFRPSFPLN
jgi:hypothetical protein